MAVDVNVRPVQDGDIEHLAARMRQADRDEIAACGRPDPVVALRRCVALSDLLWTATTNDEVACMFGVGPLSLLGGVGTPWMLGTDLITQHPGAFIRHSRPYIAVMLAAYPHLHNYVDARNTRAIRWLKRAGFTVASPVPYGPNKMPFHPFEMKA